jgi:hypothetical protein
LTIPEEFEARVGDEAIGVLRNELSEYRRGNGELCTAVRTDAAY